jgi:tight adherence protein C
MELFVLAIMLAVSAAMIIYSFLPSKAERQEIVQRRTAGRTADQDKVTLQRAARVRASKSNVFAAALPLLTKPVMPKNAEQQTTLRAKLANAGYRNESAASMFLGAKMALGLCLGLLGAVFAIGIGKESTTVLFYVMGGLGMGFLLPNFWLSMTVRSRKELIRNGLPDSLDLMVVSVEAGLGLDAALQRVADEMRTVHVALAEEMQIAVIETQMGTPRAEALSKMADRTAVQEMRALVAVITQAEKLGTSIAKALRNQAESLRVKRRQRAEERAQKTAVKLLIPLILFIFPAIFVVLAGPAAIHLMKTFNSGAITKK